MAGLPRMPSCLPEILGQRVKMVQCIEDEPDPPEDLSEFQDWCESGKSGRPIQTHTGDCGVVWKIENEEALFVVFDDGDERLLYVDEVCPLPHGI